MHHSCNQIHPYMHKQVNNAITYARKTPTDKSNMLKCIIDIYKGVWLKNIPRHVSNVSRTMITTPVFNLDWTCTTGRRGQNNEWFDLTTLDRIFSVLFSLGGHGRVGTPKRRVRGGRGVHIAKHRVFSLNIVVVARVLLKLVNAYLSQIFRQPIGRIHCIFLCLRLKQACLFTLCMVTWSVEFRLFKSVVIVF